MSSENSSQEEVSKQSVQMRERERQAVITSKFKELLSMLPEPDDHRTTRTRLDVIEDATSYIEKLRSYLQMENTDGIDARALFPHAFDKNYDNHVKLRTRNVAPFNEEGSSAQSEENVHSEQGRPNENLDSISQKGQHQYLPSDIFQRNLSK